MDFNQYLATKKAKGIAPTASLNDQNANNDITSQDGGEQTQKGGFFANLARGAAKTPLRFLGTAQSALEATGQGLFGQGDKAAETISKGSDFMRNTEKQLGYEDGEISNPYKIGSTMQEQRQGQGLFNKNTVDSFGAAAELASYGMGAPEAEEAFNLAEGGTALAKIGLNTANKEARAGAIGAAGNAMQEKNATLWSVATNAALGAGMGFAAGFATPFVSKGYQGLKNWSKAADEAVAAAKNEGAKIDTAAHWTKRTPQEELTLQKPLNEVDDDLFPPKAPSAVPLSEQMVKKAKKAGFTEVHTGIVSDMPIEQRHAALDMVDMADEKMRHFDTSPHPIEQVSKPFVDKFSRINEIKNEAGASLDGLVDSMPKEAIPLQEPTDAMHNWLDNKNVKIKQDESGELNLDFGSSVFRGNSAAKDRAVIEEVFRELHPAQAGAQTIHRTPEEIRTLRQYLKKTVDDNKASTNKMFSDQVNPMIEGVRQQLLEPLSSIGRVTDSAGNIIKESPFAVANKKYAIATNALSDFKKFLGKDFADATDEEVLMKMNEVMPRIAGNAPTKATMAIKDFMDAGESLGIPRTKLDDPRALIHVSAILDDLYGLTNPNSLKGSVERVGENILGKANTVGDMAKHPLNPIVLAQGAYKLTQGDQLLKRRQLFKEMLKEGVGPKMEAAQSTGKAVEDFAKRMTEKTTESPGTVPKVEAAAPAETAAPKRLPAL